MIRAILFLMAFLLTGGLILGTHSCGRSSTAVEAGRDKVALRDGSVIFAPDGSITRELADWLDHPIGSEMRFEVGGVQFAPGSATPVPAAMPRVARLATMLRAYPGIRANIIGATNRTGDAERDRALSQSRADALVDMLVKAGVDRTRLNARGEGSARLRYPADAPNADLNNRIVLELLRTN